MLALEFASRAYFGHVFFVKTEPYSRHEQYVLILGNQNWIAKTCLILGLASELVFDIPHGFQSGHALYVIDWSYKRVLCRVSKHDGFQTFFVIAKLAQASDTNSA